MRGALFSQITGLDGLKRLKKTGAIIADHYITPDSTNITPDTTNITPADTTTPKKVYQLDGIAGVLSAAVTSRRGAHAGTDDVVAENESEWSDQDDP